MVSLPDPNQFLGATTKPVQANLSGAEVASPYVEMAHSLDKAGEALNGYAIEEAKKAGTEAGMKARIDDNGNIIMDKAPFLVGPAAPEFRRAATMTAAAKMEPQIQNKLLEMRLQSTNDPNGFQKGASDYIDTLTSKIDDPSLKEGVKHMAAQSAAGNYRTLLTETNNNNIKDALVTYQDKLTRNTDQMESVAYQGGYDRQEPSKSTPEFKALVGTQKQLADEITGDARLNFSRARMDVLQKDTMDKINVQSMIGEVVREFKDRGNIVAAKNALQDKFYGPEGDKIKLSPQQRDRGVTEGVKRLSLLDAADRETIRDNQKATIAFIKDTIDSPSPLNPYEYQRRMEDARAMGDKVSGHELDMLPVRKDYKTFFSALTPQQQMEANGYINSGQWPPGFHPRGGPAQPPGPVAQPLPGENIPGLNVPPEGAAGPAGTRFGGLPQSFVEGIKRSEGLDLTAKWDFKQPTYGYGTRAPYVGARTNKEQAEKDLDADLTKASKVVDAINPNLDPGTRAALTSLTFNAGSAWTSGALGQKIRAGDIEGAKQPFLAYIHAGGAPLKALQDRRAQEVAWFGAAQAAPGAPAAVMGEAGVAGAPMRGTFAGNPAGVKTMTNALADTHALTVKTADSLFKGVAEMLNDGAHLAPGEADLAVSTAYFSGMDPNKIDELVTKLKAGAAAGQVKPNELSEAINNIDIAKASGIPAQLYPFAKQTQKLLEANQKELMEQPLIYGAKNLGTQAPNPINLKDPMAMVGELKTRQTNADRMQELVPNLGAVPLIGKQEAVNVGHELVGGDGAAAMQFVTALRTLPDANYLATLEQPGIKEAVVSLSNSNDPVKMGAGMAAMATAWQTNKPQAEQIFGKMEINRMQEFRGLEFLNAAERVERMNSTEKPDVIEERVAKTEAEIKKITPEDVAYQMGHFYGPHFIGRAIGAIPGVPAEGIGQVGGVSADELAVDYKETVTAFRKKDVPLEKAKALAAERLQSKWTVSEVAGGVLMKNAPELYYDKIDGSYDWMKKQQYNAMTKVLGPQTKGGFVPSEVLGAGGEVGTQWTMMGLVADARTEFEIASKRPPSYKVAYKDANGMPQLMEGRMLFDPGEVGSEFGPQLEENAPIGRGPLGEAQAAARARTAANQERYHPNYGATGPRFIRGTPP